ncbi:hypothetical protein MRX96_025677 [Rhipicephalus microplus]
MVPQHDLRTIVNSLSVPNEWARLDALDFDGVVFATTSVKKEPFALLHERVLMFATDCTDIVIARLYFRGKERKDVPIRSVKEAAETFRYSDSAILCKAAMGQAEFDNNYSKDITCHLKHSVDIVYGIVLSRSCSGIVSKEGRLCYTVPSLRFYTVTKKIKVVQWYHQGGINVHATSRHLNIDRRRIREWDSKYVALLQQNFGKSKSRRKLSNCAPILSKEADDALFEFFASQCSGMHAVSNRLLAEEAVRVARSLQLKNFVASRP